MASTTRELPDWIRNFFTRDDVNEETMKDFYKKYSTDYDEIAVQVGYPAPMIVSKAFDQAANKLYGTENAKKLRILDIGAGTGLEAKLLKGLGYNNIDAVDCCADMLQKAKEKNLYKKVFVRFVDERKNEEIDDGNYGALVACGSISGPQIQARAFNEMLRWLKKDGIFCFSIRKVDIESTERGYKETFQDMEETSKWKVISRDLVDYIQNPGDHESMLTKAYIYVYQKL